MWYGRRAAIIRKRINLRLLILNLELFCLFFGKYYNFSWLYHAKNYKHYHFSVSIHVPIQFLLYCHFKIYISSRSTPYFVGMEENQAVPTRNKNLATLFISELKLSVQGFCLLKVHFFLFPLSPTASWQWELLASETNVALCCRLELWLDLEVFYYNIWTKSHLSNISSS